MISLTETGNQFYLVKANYRNLPAGVIPSTLPDSVKIEVSASGFNVMFYDPPVEGIIIDCANPVMGKKAGDTYILLSKKEKEVSMQIGAEVTLVSIRPDTIFFHSFGPSRKEVPVVFKGNINLPADHQLRDSVQIFPEMVMLSGEDSILASYSLIETEKFAFTAGSVAGSFRVKLLSPGSEVALHQDSVTIRFTPEKFSAIEIMVPVTITNLPSGYSFIPVPREVKVKAMIPFSRIRQFSKDDLEVSVDFNEIKKLSDSQAKLKVTSGKNFARQITASPNSVEFILREKSN